MIATRQQLLLTGEEGDDFGRKFLSILYGLLDVGYIPFFQLIAWLSEGEDRSVGFTFVKFRFKNGDACVQHAGLDVRHRACSY